jgi:putative ATPase
MDDLFGKNTNKRVCEDVSFILADRIRPQVLSEIIGQEHLLGDGKPLRKMVESDEISSLILWGPPGSGKTTLAKVIANVTSMDFLSFSAVLSSIKEIKKVMANSERNLYLYGNRSILFIDEIHRFNKAQQDAFLSFIERGTIILIGATTENPSFEIISPLLSRVQIFILNPLEPEHIETILIRALTDQDKGLGLDKEIITPTALEMISNICSGDARYALNLLELAVKLSDKVTVDSIKEILNRERVIYDKSGEEHYNLISALHKSIRDSDPQGAIYWIARMLEGGEDPKYIIRRLIRMSMEDVGLADPNALLIATAAQNAYIFIGSPEGDIALADCICSQIKFT